MQQKRRTSLLLTISPKRISVENWVYDPTQYKKEPLIKINGLTYLNSYQPNDLVAVKGDTKISHNVKSRFLWSSKYKDHFINFHAFNYKTQGSNKDTD